ncbi:MAG: class F sortase [Marmoricola sp.]
MKLQALSKRIAMLAGTAGIAGSCVFLGGVVLPSLSSPSAAGEAPGVVDGTAPVHRTGSMQRSQRSQHPHRTQHARHQQRSQAAQVESLSAPAAPMRLVVPSIALDSTVLPIDVSAAGVLDPPADPHQVGWWQSSARPGERAGQTVLTGHTVHTGGGVMNNLGQIHDGDAVEVVTPKGTMRYRVALVRYYSKAELTQSAVDLFGQDRRKGRLVLVTCTGWTGHDYTGNTVVTATPLAAPA